MFRLCSWFFVSASVAFWFACADNTVDLIVDPDSGTGGAIESDDDTDTDQDDEFDAGETEDKVIANIKVDEDFEENPLKITMGFVEVPPFPPSQETVANGAEYEKPNIGPQVDYLYESGQAGLTGQYSLLFVLYVEGGGIDEGTPVIGTDYMGYSFPVELGPGTGAVWAGTVMLRNMDWQ